MPTKKVVSILEELDGIERRVDNLLEELEVPVIHTTFERLFAAGNDTTEWMRLFSFLGVGPTTGLTASDVRKAGHAATSSTFHNVTLLNYEEVRRTLSGTKFESLLH